MGDEEGGVAVVFDEKGIAVLRQKLAVIAQLLGWNGSMTSPFIAVAWPVFIALFGVLSAATIALTPTSLSLSSKFFQSFRLAALLVFLFSNAVLWQRAQGLLSRSFHRRQEVLSDSSYNILVQVGFRAAESDGIDMALVRRCTLHLRMWFSFAVILTVTLALQWSYSTMFPIEDGVFDRSLVSTQRYFVLFILRVATVCVLLPTVYSTIAATFSSLWIGWLGFLAMESMSRELHRIQRERGALLTQGQLESFVSTYVLVTDKIREITRAIEVPLCVLVVVNVLYIVVEALLIVAAIIDASGTARAVFVDPRQPPNSLPGHIYGLFLLTISLLSFLVPGVLITVGAKGLNSAAAKGIVLHVACLSSPIAGVPAGEDPVVARRLMMKRWKLLNLCLKEVDFSWELIGIKFGPQQLWLVISAALSVLALAFTKAS